MALQSKVGMRGAELPDLDCPVEGGTGKLVVVLGVEHDHHHIVGVALEDL